MAGEDGINVVLQVDDGAASFDILGGQTSTTFSPSTNVADSTNKDGAGWQEGVSTTRSGDVSASGIADAADPAFLTLKDAWLNGTVEACELILDVAGKKWSGNFRVESMSWTGDIGSATTYDIALKSDGVLTFA